MKKYSFIVVLLLFVMTGTVVAETSNTDSTTATPTTSATSVPAAKMQEKREVVKEKKEAWQEKQEETRALIKEKREDFFTTTKEVRTDLQEKRVELMGNLKANRAELEAQIKEKREAFKAEITEIKKERATVRKSFVETRFAEAIKMLTTAQERVGAKIDEFEADGEDVSEASMHLAESKDSLATAVALLETLKSTAVSDTSETTVTKPREIAKQIEAALKESREHLREAIKAIKAALGEPTEPTPENGSTTTTTN